MDLYTLLQECYENFIHSNGVAPDLILYNDDNVDSKTITRFAKLHGMMCKDLSECPEESVYMLRTGSDID